MEEEGVGEIRLVRETVILYASVAVRVVASIVFLVLIARYLSVGEFAMYGVVSAFSLLVPAAANVWSYWAGREVAWRLQDPSRGPPGVAGGTGALLTLAFGLAVLPLYTGFSLALEWLMGWEPLLVLLGYPYLVLNSYAFYLRELSSVVAPRLYAYARIVFDVGRLALAAPLVAVLGMGYAGAMAATIAALAASLGLLAARLWLLRVIAAGFDWGLARRWLGAWRVPVLLTAADLFRNAPRPFLSLVTASERAVAYLNVGVTSQSVLLQASQMSQPALYAKLLREKTGRALEESLALYAVFTGLIVAPFLYLARPLATLFNPVYLEAEWILRLVTLYSLLLGLANIYRTTLLALDQADRHTPGAEGPIMAWASKTYVALLTTAYIASTPLLRLLRGKPLESVAAFIIVLTASTTIILGLYAHKTRSLIAYRVPWRDVAAAALGLLASGAYYLLSGAANLVVEDINTRTTAILGAHIALGTLTYLATTTPASPMARRLTKRALEIFSRLAGRPRDRGKQRAGQSSGDADG